MSENISTLIGIVVDVSGSMKSNVGNNFYSKPGSWIRSVFQVIDDLIKHDVSASNHVFAVGVGASCETEIFDLLSTLDKVQKLSLPNNIPLTAIIDRILGILEDNGADSVRKCARSEDIAKVVSHEAATLILGLLQSDRHFVQTFVNVYLPPACKRYTPDALKGSDNLFFSAVSGFVNMAESSVAAMRPAILSEIQDIITQANSYVEKGFLQKVNVTSSCYSVKEASRILHGCIDENTLTENRIQELLDNVKPFIYGRMPMYDALKKTHNLFSSLRYRDHKKLLFILSDGKPTDNGNIVQMKSSFEESEVYIVSCFITSSTQIEPKRLYCAMLYHWDEGAKFLFYLSSKVPTQLLPCAILIKRGWKIDIANNETRLFTQVNHPDHIEDVCDLAKNVVCCQDALADLLVSVSLDIYINQDTTGFKAKSQVGGTCYANAAAAVLHLSMKRILGRKGGYPNFNDLLQDLITRYGKDGANPLRVLQDVCPQYRLNCKHVDIMCALRALTAKRQLLQCFGLPIANGMSSVRSTKTTIQGFSVGKKLTSGNDYQMNPQNTGDTQ